MGGGRISESVVDDAVTSVGVDHAADLLALLVVLTPLSSEAAIGR
jgi:hypothetical protein